MSTVFKSLEISPGVVVTCTKKQRSSNWGEANMVRWTEGQLAPVGGQSNLGFTFASRCRRQHGWFGLDGVYYIAHLCEEHLYVSVGPTLTDITPTGGIAPAPSPSSGGYSDGFYSDGTYNYSDPPPIGVAAQIDKIPNAFSLANFGALLLAMTSPDSRLLFWDPAVGGLAKEVVASTTPAGGVVPRGRLFVVTQERFVQIFGAYDVPNGGSFRRIAWCDQENITNWNYTDVTTQAAFIDVEPSSPIIAAIATRTGTVFWTTKKVYCSRYLGLPYIYDYEELGEACTPWSPQSTATTAALTVWMSQQGPYSYDGTSVLPVQCPVRAWIDDDIDLLNVREQAFAVHVSNFNEVWWFFPQLGQPYNTRAIYFNYKEGWWGMARMARSAGITASYSAHTVMANGTVAYQHEDGLVYNDAEPPWVETFDININSGAGLSTVKQMIPDVEGATRNLLYSLFYRNSRSAGLDEIRTTPRGVRTDGYVDFRATGRDIRLRIDLALPVGVKVDATGVVGGAKEPIIIGSGNVLPVTIGQHLIDSVPRGDR